MDYTVAALNCVSTKMFYFVGNWHEEAFQEIEEEVWYSLPNYAVLSDINTDRLKMKSSYITCSL